MENSTKKKGWLKYVLIVIGLILLFKMCEGLAEIGEKASENKEEVIKLELPEYTTVEKDCGSEPCNITIMLDQIIDSTEVAAIGEKIRDERSNFKRVFVFFLQPGMISGSGAWAAVRYNPEREVEIMGFTKDSYQKAKDKMDAWNPEKTWVWHNGLASSLIGVKQKKIYTIWSKMSETEDDIIFIKDKTSFKEKSNTHGESFQINKTSGNLELVNGEGKVFSTAVKL